MLNNIQKVCILHIVLMYGLIRLGVLGVLAAGGAVRGLGSTSTRRLADTQAFHRSVVWCPGPEGLPT